MSGLIWPECLVLYVVCRLKAPTNWIKWGALIASPLSPSPLSHFFFFYTDKCSGIRVGTYHAPRGRKQRLPFSLQFAHMVGRLIGRRVDISHKAPLLLATDFLFFFFPPQLHLSVNGAYSTVVWVPSRVSSFHRICTPPCTGLTRTHTQSDQTTVHFPWCRRLFLFFSNR